MADIDLQKVHDTLVSIAFEAGRMILAADPNNIPKGTKKNCKFFSRGNDCILRILTD